MLRPASGGFEALCLKRAPHKTRAGTWETVHGKIDEGELPADAARRELREETGLKAERLYNLSRVESFYQHKLDEISLIPVFAAIVPAGAQVALSEEHDDHAWLAPALASERYAWPRERRALADAMLLLAAGHAGGLEEILLV